MAWRRVGVHAFEMPRQQHFHAVVVEVDEPDRSHPSSGYLGLVDEHGCALGHPEPALDSAAMPTVVRLVSLRREPARSWPARRSQRVAARRRGQGPKPHVMPRSVRSTEALMAPSTAPC
jgi:hypothetical protein